MTECARLRFVMSVKIKTLMSGEVFMLVHVYIMVLSSVMAVWCQLYVDRWLCIGIVTIYSAVCSQIFQIFYSSFYSGVPCIVFWFLQYLWYFAIRYFLQCIRIFTTFTVVFIQVFLAMYWDFYKIYGTLQSCVPCNVLGFLQDLRYFAIVCFLHCIGIFTRFVVICNQVFLTMYWDACACRSASTHHESLSHML